MRADLQLVLTISQAELADPTRIVVSLFNQLAPLVGRPPLPDVGKDDALELLIQGVIMRERLRCLELAEQALDQMQRYDETVQRPLIEAMLAMKRGA